MAHTTATSQPENGGSLRSYARHRRAAGLPGGTHYAVQKAAEVGRISVVTVDGAPRIQNFKTADREWRESTDPARNDRYARRAAARQRSSDDPIPIEKLSVMVVDVGIVCMVNLADEREDEGYVLDAATAEQLAALLLEQAARARREWPDRDPDGRSPDADHHREGAAVAPPPAARERDDA